MTRSERQPAAILPDETGSPALRAIVFEM